MSVNILATTVQSDAFSFTLTLLDTVKDRQKMYVSLRRAAYR